MGILIRGPGFVIVKRIFFEQFDVYWNSNDFNEDRFKKFIL